jgi:lysozyme
MINAVVDLSHHNSVDNFQRAYDSGIRAVIHKATQGTTYVDPTFRPHLPAMHSANLLLGAYHFGVAGNASEQATHFLSVARPHTTLLVLDFEGNPQGQDMQLAEAEEFVHTVAAATGRYPGLYSGHTIKEALKTAGIHDPAQTILSRCWLWIAQYGPTALVPPIWPRWTMWQYTDGAAGPEPHQVAGIGRCDRNQFAGTEQQLRRFWTGAESAPTPAKKTRVRTAKTTRRRRTRNSR